MDGRSEKRTETDGTVVEVGTIVHEGREFSALGAVVSETHAAGYPHFPTIDMGRGAANMVAEHVGSRGEMRDWSGARIGTCRIVASWSARSHWHGTMYQIEATIDGKVYTGRGLGHGMIWKGKRKAGSK